MTINNNFDLSSVLWYKIGGTVKYYLECKNKNDILEAIAFIKENNIAKIFIFGQGSNVIFAEDYFEGAAVHISSDKENEVIKIDKEGHVEAFAGELLDSVITFSLDHNSVGLEWAGGLPGTVGAAVRGNVGAYGGEIKDTLFSAEILDFSEEVPKLKTLSNSELEFAYRESFVKMHKSMIVISAKFNLKLATDQEIISAREVYEKNIQNRKDRHPLEYPNCGSVFKNLRDKDQIEKVLSIYPDLKEDVEKKWYGKVAVATLIERLGFKGFRIGDAQVSEKHALFIVNLGRAKAADVLEVISTIQNKFQETFGFTLETEVEIVK
ncbi:UDP-N-acetylmuramate dehydrogenase [Candidatus Roizmanbacteria bacterium]|nr:UDP-N-acetylmuramate dehydrogenase [Candidatus Roizmanbacteria bacterium]